MQESAALMMPRRSSADMVVSLSVRHLKPLEPKGNKLSRPFGGDRCLRCSPPSPASGSREGNRLPGWAEPLPQGLRVSTVSGVYCFRRHSLKAAAVLAHPFVQASIPSQPHAALQPMTRRMHRDHRPVVTQLAVSPWTGLKRRSRFSTTVGALLEAMVDKQQLPDNGRQRN